jgi:hypothetical protein
LQPPIKKKSSALLNFREIVSLVRKEEGEDTVDPSKIIQRNFARNKITKKMSSKLIAYTEKINGVISERQREMSKPPADDDEFHITMGKVSPNPVLNI